jgi:hypothetical protein
MKGTVLRDGIGGGRLRCSAGKCKKLAMELGNSPGSGYGYPDCVKISGFNGFCAEIIISSGLFVFFP